MAETTTPDGLPDEFLATTTLSFEEMLTEARNSGEGILSQLRDEQLEDARTALRRYAQNQLEALRDPARQQTHLMSASHNLNTLENLTASSKILVRTEARAFLDRVMARMWDIADQIIIAAVVA